MTAACPICGSPVEIESAHAEWHQRIDSAINQFLRTREATRASH